MISIRPHSHRLLNLQGLFALPIRQHCHHVLSVLFALLIIGLFPASPPAHAQDGPQAVILQYHHISTTTPAVSSTSPEDFRRHMQYLQDNNFNILPMEEVIAALRSGSELPDRTAVITFDDGYATVYSEAFPILQEYGWPFTVFVTTGLLQNNARLYADWDQIREMAAAGATIANHTVSHPYMLDREEGKSQEQWLERNRRQIMDAEAAIIRETGQNHRLLAYPYGEYDRHIQDLLIELDFTGFAQNSGAINSSSDFTALPRYPFGGIYASMNTYPTKVDSLAFTLASVEPDSPLTDELSPSFRLQLAPESNARLNQLACFNANQPISVTRVDGAVNVFEVTTQVENRGRRFQYNCTAPGADGRFYWYSKQWINPAVPE